VAGPTTGQTDSSSSAGSVEERSLSAGQALVSVLEMVEGRAGCAERLWWWSVEALVMGQTWPGLEASKEGWKGGRTVLVVPRGKVLVRGSRLRWFCRDEPGRAGRAYQRRDRLRPLL